MVYNIFKFIGMMHSTITRKQMISHLLLAVFLIAMLAGIIYIGVDGTRITS